MSSGLCVALQQSVEATDREAVAKETATQHGTIINAISFYSQDRRKCSTACKETVSKKQQGCAKLTKCLPTRYLE